MPIELTEQKSSMPVSFLKKPLPSANNHNTNTLSLLIHGLQVLSTHLQCSPILLINLWPLLRSLYNYFISVYNTLTPRLVFCSVKDHCLECFSQAGSLNCSQRSLSLVLVVVSESVDSTEAPSVLNAAIMP